MKTAPRWVILALAVLAAGRAWAGPAELSASLGEASFASAGVSAPTAFYFLKGFQQRPPADAAVLVAPNAYGKPIQSIPLAPLLDNARGTKAAFRAGNVVVHVFGGKSANKDNWFIGFAPEGAEDQFYKGSKMIHWVFLNRTVHFTIAGRKYAAYIEGKATDKMRSVVTVEPADKSEAKSSWTVQELSDDAYAAGTSVTLSGKEYRLVYSRDFTENDKGDFGGYNGDRSIVLLSKEDGKLVGYHWFEREIPRDRILVSTPKATGADDDEAGKLTVGLRLNAGSLEIYPARP
jgi:hypothetical protein